MTSKIVNDIAVMIPIAHLKTPNPPYDKIPQIFYFESAHGFNFQPTEYVDITDFFETKKSMMSCHESQMAWTADNFNTDESDFLEMIEIMGKFRGMQSGVKYAEGFVRARDAYRMTCERILP